MLVSLRSRDKMAKREKQIETLEGMLNMAQLDFATLLRQKDELTCKLKDVRDELSETKSDFEHTVTILRHCFPSDECSVSRLTFSWMIADCT
jgi:uncharacterized coiled-coil protein SlyX